MHTFDRECMCPSCVSFARKERNQESLVGRMFGDEPEEKISSPRRKYNDQRILSTLDEISLQASGKVIN